MKNIINILYILFGTVFALGACQSEGIQDTPTEADKPIEFSGVYATIETKSAEGLPVNDFRVWASRTYTVGSVTDTEYGIFGVTGTEVTNSSTGSTPSWAYSPVRYWRPGTYDFIAVSPLTLAEGELTNDGLELDFGDGWDLCSSQTDLWIASTPNVSNEVVPLTFNRMLSKISFTAVNVATDLDIFVTGFKVYGLCKKAISYSIGYGWTCDNPASATTPYKSYTLSSVELPITGETPYSLTTDGGFLAFPGEISLGVEVTFNHGGNTTNYSKSTSVTDTWVAGTHYEYKINIGPDYIEFNPVSVQPWDDNEGNGYTADDSIEF